MKRSIQGRDIAMFFAGWAAAETLGHWLLGILGSDVFPMTVGGFTFTSKWNTFAMVAWPIVLVALVYVSCVWKKRPEPHSASPTPSARPPAGSPSGGAP